MSGLRVSLGSDVTLVSGGGDNPAAMLAAFTGGAPLLSRTFGRSGLGEELSEAGDDAGQQLLIKPKAKSVAGVEAQPELGFAVNLQDDREVGVDRRVVMGGRDVQQTEADAGGFFGVKHDLHRVVTGLRYDKHGVAVPVVVELEASRHGVTLTVRDAFPQPDADEEEGST